MSTCPPLSLRVAHLIRPAEGGMRAQVRALLEATTYPLVAAPPDVLSALQAGLPPLTGLPVAPDGSPGSLLRAGQTVGRWAKAQNAHLLHGHGLRWSPLFAAASLASGLPLVETLHNLVPSPSPLARCIAQIALRKARRLLVVSGAVRHSLARTLGRPLAARCRIVYNGVDLTRFASPDLPAKADARQRLSLPPAAKVALCVARLSPEKDVGLFLEAASLIPDADARFLVAGDGSLKPALLQQINVLGLQHRALLLGAREDIPLLLRAADVFCQPSREEGLGIAAIEAMAAGLPVVATHVGGLPEVVVENETGILVPSRHPVLFAEALRDLLDNPARAKLLGHAGRARAETCFSREAMLTNTHAVYAEALGVR